MQLKPDVVGSNAETSCRAGEVPYDLAIAMNYGSSTGSPQLVRFLTEHTEHVHNPPYDDWDTFTTRGTTSLAMDIDFKIFCDPGDTVLMEEYSYSGTITTTKSQELKSFPVRVDDKGLSPVDPDAKLSIGTPPSAKSLICFTQFLADKTRPA
jgi:aromatic amino acid aminotransferase I